MKKILKRIFLLCIIFAIIVILFKDSIYFELMEYKSNGLREDYYPKSGILLVHILNTHENKILSYRENQDTMDIQEIIKASLKITSKNLRFTSTKCEIDPNKVIETRKTNCTGYASFFSTTCNLLLRKHDQSNDWMALSHIGQLYLLGYNVHSFFSYPFVKDHDFVVIQNKTSGQVFAVDPSLNDYTGIEYVKYHPE